MKSAGTRWVGVALALVATACGNSTPSDETNETTMAGTLGLAVSAEGAAVVYAGYHRVPEGCRETYVAPGECAVSRECSVTPTARTFDAGIVTIAGVSLTNPLSYFDVLSGPVPYGQSIVAEATGTSEVPAHALSLLVPEPSMVVEPSPGGLVVDRTRDLVVRWQGGSGGAVGVAVSDAGTSVFCLAATSAGSMTLPARLLAELEPTDVSAPGAFRVTQSDSASTTKGEWAFGFYAAVEILQTEAVVE
jgi:hypothetical protein